MVAGHDRWVKILAQSGHLRAVAVTATHVVEDAAKRHQLDPMGTILLGEGLLAALLLSSRIKAEEKLSVNIQASGLLRRAIIDANPQGHVRGFLAYASDPEVPPPGIGPWGEGLIAVIRTAPFQKEPYVGTSLLKTGYLAKDMTLFMHQSEQVYSAIGLTVRPAMNGQPLQAGAFLVEVLPGASEREVKTIEDNIHAIQKLSSQLEATTSPTHFLSTIFTEQAFNIVEERPVSFTCSCSKEHVLNAMALLPKDDLMVMMTEDKGAVTTCDFCRVTYTVSVEELKEMMALS